MKPKCQVVLEALRLGIPVELNGIKMYLIDNELCSQGKTIKSDQTEELIYLKHDTTLKNFIEMSERLSHEKIFIIAANIALNKAK